LTVVGARWVIAEPESAALVRRDIARDLMSIGVSSETVDNVLIVASELVGNAIRHANALPSGQLQVSWEHSPGGITVSVTDGGGPQHPEPRDAGPDDTTGRGLSIVSVLADFWGVKRAPGTVTVWAHLPEHRADRRVSI
jgi:serine/threonine-protein kinase RsbW